MSYILVKDFDKDKSSVRTSAFKYSNFKFLSLTTAVDEDGEYFHALTIGTGIEDVLMYIKKEVDVSNFMSRYLDDKSITVEVEELSFRNNVKSCSHTKGGSGGLSSVLEAIVRDIKREASKAQKEQSDKESTKKEGESV